MQERSEAVPQCCYWAKGAKRPSHTTKMLTSSNQVLYILAATALVLLTGQPRVTKCGPYKIYAAGLNTPDKLWSLANLE